MRLRASSRVFLVLCFLYSTRKTLLLSLLSTFWSCGPSFFSSLSLLELESPGWEEVRSVGAILTKYTDRPYGQGPCEHSSLQTRGEQSRPGSGTSTCPGAALSRRLTRGNTSLF